MLSFFVQLCAIKEEANPLIRELQENEYAYTVIDKEDNRYYNTLL